jgi:hypothetical protein
VVFQDTPNPLLQRDVFELYGKHLASQSRTRHNRNMCFLGDLLENPVERAVLGLQAQAAILEADCRLPAGSLNS